MAESKERLLKLAERRKELGDYYSEKAENNPDGKDDNLKKAKVAYERADKAREDAEKMQLPY